MLVFKLLHLQKYFDQPLIAFNDRKENKFLEFIEKCFHCFIMSNMTLLYVCPEIVQLVMN